MKRVVLSDDGETVELRLTDGAVIYVSGDEEGGFRVISEAPLMIQPRMDNSIRIVVSPSVRERRKREKP